MDKTDKKDNRILDPGKYRERFKQGQQKSEKERILESISQSISNIEEEIQKASKIIEKDEPGRDHALTLMLIGRIRELKNAVFDLATELLKT